MTIKRILFRTKVRGLERLCLIQKPKHSKQCHLSLDMLPTNNRHTDIVTIAFNNAQIIPLHCQYIQKYYQDEHTHIVADNSTDREASNQIRKYCEENKVSYIRIPKNLLDGSYSHATALNWVCKHVIRKRNPHYLGFTDHDLFPIRPVSLSEMLDRQHIYGPLRHRGDYWYLSAILCFFDYSFIGNRKMDFMPVNYDGKTYLDTGGGNWLDIYSAMDLNTIHFCAERMENFREGENRHQDQLEFFDDFWLHTINGSYWKKISISKENILPALIRHYEEQ